MSIATFETFSDPEPQTLLWEILVPTTRRTDCKPYRVRYHRVWDARVRAISHGLTIMSPVKGQWKSLEGEMFAERMIPVRFIATREQAAAVAEMTAEYYDQLAVMCYRVSDDVIMVHRKPGG